MSDSTFPYRIPSQGRLVKRESSKSRPSETNDDSLMAQLQDEFSLISPKKNQYDYTGNCIHAVNGVELVTDSEGVAYWPTEDTLVVADLHLEKGSSFARRGMLIPPYDTKTTLRRFAKCIDKWKPKRVIALGDSFHDAQASERLSTDNFNLLQSLMKDRDWVWITGNHDPTPPVGLGGDVTDCLRQGSLVFLHEPQIDNHAGEIAGHLHPKALLVRRGRHVRRSCFAADKKRMIMPSFGAYTGGLDIFDPAFDELFDGKKFHALMRGDDQVYRIPANELKNEPSRKYTEPK